MSTLDELMAAHTAALAAYDANNENYDQDEDAEGKAVDAARDALLEHQPVTGRVHARQPDLHRVGRHRRVQADPGSHSSGGEAGMSNDALHQLVNAYVSNHAIYNAAKVEEGSDEDQALYDAWHTPYMRLNENPPSATTLEGALAAICMVADEEENCGGQPRLTVNVLRAALAYFEKAEKEFFFDPRTGRIAGEQS